MAHRDMDLTRPASITETPAARPPGWAVATRRITDYCSRDLLGGPRPLSLASVVNVQKGATFVVYGLLMWHYGNTSTVAWIFLAMQGSYGLVWLVKAASFPDRSWQVKITVGAALCAFTTVLGPYWVFGWILFSRTSAPHYPLPTASWCALCISLCILGCVLMMVADAQKFFTLRVKGGLITDGLYRWIRHPNYLGEILIYGSFALMVWHWFPVIVLAWVWLILFTVNMIMIESSLSRYPEWPQYKRRSWWLIPFLL